MTMLASTATPLAQTLAIQSQIHLPGTVGRILKQIRDLERIAPKFVSAGLVKPVNRQNPLTVRVSGIATKGSVVKTVGGFLFGSAASRIDLKVEANGVGTAGQDSTCIIDDINYENQSKRMALAAVKQAYELADRAVEEGVCDILFMDTPLVMDRSLVPRNEAGEDEGYRVAYQDALAATEHFWSRHREQLFPWNPNGPVVVGLAAERFGAIIRSASDDLRHKTTRDQILPDEGITRDQLQLLDGIGATILSIGERRFVHGILGSFTRTAAFRINLHAPRMEPASVVSHGVIGLHYRADIMTGPRLIQLIGDAPLWTQAEINRVVGIAMTLTAVGGAEAAPLPVQLADKELTALEPFLDHYRRSVAIEMKQRHIEDTWLGGLGQPL